MRYHYATAAQFLSNVARVTSTVGQRIAHARSIAGLSGHELARSIGLSSLNTISQYETGKRSPQPGRLRAIAEATDVSLEWLTHGIGDPRPSAAVRDDLQIERLERKLDRVLATQQTLLRALGVKTDASDAEEAPARDRAALVVDAVARGSRAAQRPRSPRSPRASQHSGD